MYKDIDQNRKEFFRVNNFNSFVHISGETYYIDFKENSLSLYFEENQGFYRFCNALERLRVIRLSLKDVIIYLEQLEQDELKEAFIFNSHLFAHGIW